MEDVFFIASKLAWGVLSPSNLIILMMLLGTVLLVKGAIVEAKWILIPTVLFSIFVMIYPIGDSVISPLENRFLKPAILPERIDGIIILGGGEDLMASVSWGTAELGAGGDRYIAAAVLAKHYPHTPVIFSGGHNTLRLQVEASEGAIAEHLLTAVGINKQRLIIESKSRNTYENFLRLTPLLPSLAGQYLLVTSAFHMPRAMGIAQQQGINVIAYPVDYRSQTPELRQWGFNLYSHLEVLEPAWREWIGLTAYYVMGKTKQWFPRPGELEILQKSQAD